MPMNASPSSDPVRPGRISRALLRLFMKHASVAACEDIAEHFRLITLEGPTLRGVAWIPGQKIQIAMGSAFVSRTYTPIEWNAAAGRTRLLGYAHGDGPGSAWISGARQGDTCDIFGPRRSLDVNALPGPVAVLGDETSIGLACAFLRQGRTRADTCLFEVDNIEAGSRVLARFGLEGAALFGRHGNGAHLDGMEAELPALIARDATFVLTGDATTIQRLRRTLKSLGVPHARLVTKAYWAPGKTGLD